MKRSDNATCNFCKQKGILQIISVSGTTKVRDYIKHLPSCPQYPKKRAKHFLQKKWEKQERLANSLVGASETEASGARHKDGDGRRLFEWRVESKQTKNELFRLYFSVWTELLYKCKIAGELPLLHIQIAGHKYCGVSPSWFFEYSGLNSLDVSGEITNQKVKEFFVDKKSIQLKKFLFTESSVIGHFYKTNQGGDIVIISEPYFKEILQNV